MTLGLNPPKGTADRKPEEFRIRKYIFETWRSVCESFWYQEYLWPLVEPAAIREAKSGEDVWGTELTKITNRDGEISDLALRPEMTPTVTRMIAKYQREYSKPIRRFSIANFYRNERPQRGRNREFWQCNVDIFWTMTYLAEIEILQMSIEIMKRFGAKRDQFELRINHRWLNWRVIWLLLEVEKIEFFSTDWVKKLDFSKAIVRLLDKRDKLSKEVMIESLWDLMMKFSYTHLWKDRIYELFSRLYQCKTLAELVEFIPQLQWENVIKELWWILNWLNDLWYWEHIKFSPSLMRGFDYYDGMVFEVFDLHPENNRALFGWGRYNGLADIFGVKEPIPAVWFAPGDEPMKLFLESRELLPEELGLETYFVPLIDGITEWEVMKKAQVMRSEWKRVVTWTKVMTEQKAFDHAKKNWWKLI